MVKKAEKVASVAAFVMLMVTSTLLNPNHQRSPTKRYGYVRSTGNGAVYVAAATAPAGRCALNGLSNDRRGDPDVAVALRVIASVPARKWRRSRVGTNHDDICVKRLPPANAEWSATSNRAASCGVGRPQTAARVGHEISSIRGDEAKTTVE